MRVTRICTRLSALALCVVCITVVATACGDDAIDDPRSPDASTASSEVPAQTTVESDANVTVIVSIEAALDGQTLSLKVDGSPLNVPPAQKPDASRTYHLRLGPGEHELTVAVGTQSETARLDASEDRQWVGVVYWGSEQSKPLEVILSETPIAAQ